MLGACISRRLQWRRMGRSSASSAAGRPASICKASTSPVAVLQASGPGTRSRRTWRAKSRRCRSWRLATATVTARWRSLSSAQLRRAPRAVHSRPRPHRRRRRRQRAPALRPMAQQLRQAAAAAARSGTKSMRTGTARMRSSHQLWSGRTCGKVWKTGRQQCARRGDAGQRGRPPFAAIP